VPYEKTKNTQARFLRQRSKRIDCFRYIHSSRTMEL
jgi:hypothetical protein